MGTGKKSVSYEPVPLSVTYLLQPDAFCEHTIQQHSTAARAPSWFLRATAVPAGAAESAY